MGMIPAGYDLSKSTTEGLSELLGSKEVVLLLPVGCVEPHGPHLGLATDTVISVAAAVNACDVLSKKGVTALIGPSVAYGVTECAAAFAGAVGVSAPTLTRFLVEVVRGYLKNGFAHVCLVNNHLEPEHDAAVHDVRDDIDDGRVSVACPLKRRWARTLSDEFKSGACHAGEYESSIVMAADPDYIDAERAASLEENPVSLSEKLSSGINDFKEMGLTRAYAGAPARATKAHGAEQLELLGAMIVSEVLESMAG